MQLNLRAVVTMNVSVEVAEDLRVSLEAQNALRNDTIHPIMLRLTERVMRTFLKINRHATRPQTSSNGPQFMFKNFPIPLSEVSPNSTRQNGINI